MKRRDRLVRAAAAVATLLAAALADADMFRHRETGEVIRGNLLGTAHEAGHQQYLIRKADGSRAVLPTVDWEHTPGTAPASPRTPREASLVCFIQVEGPLESRRARDEVLRAIAAAGQRSPRAVVVEIDTPGGRLDYAQSICHALEALPGCKTVAFVKGGQYRGAFSAGALVAMACQEIYIAEGCSIGAAALFVARGESLQFADKVTSAFSATFRALAEKHRRPPTIAAAMVDPEAELREVIVGDKSHFEPPDRAKELADDGGRLGRWIKRRGRPLALTAAEASELGIATGIATTREGLLTAIGCPDAQAADLATSEAIRRAFAEDTRLAESLRRQIEAEKRALAAVHPKVDTRPRRRESTRASIASIDRCLALYEKLLDLARAEPGLGYQESEILRDAATLTAQKHKLMGF